MEQQSVRQPAERFDILDGMRGIAAFSVMLHHFTLHSGYSIFRNAYIAVDVFFILSGFVLAHSYAARLKDGMRFFAFMRRRVIRLYPAFFLGLLLGAPVFIVFSLAGHTTYSMAEISKSLACNLLFLPYLNQGSLLYDTGIVPGIIFPVNNILWTLFFEMAASAAFVLLVRCSCSALVKLALACYGLLLAYGVYFSLITHIPVLISGLGWNTATFTGGFPRVFYGFACGMALYLSLDRLKTHRYANYLAKVPHAPFFLFAALLALLASPFGMKGTYYFLAIGVAPLLVLAGALAHCDGRAARAACTFMGRLSYPLYCLHYPVGLAIYLLYSHYGLQEDEAAMVVTATLVTLVLSSLAVKYYEEPARRFLAEKFLGAHIPQT